MLVRLALMMAAIGISPAFAQPGATSPGAVDDGTEVDPIAGRAWFAPTALTPPEGSMSFSSTELVILTGSYSPADTIQLSANALLPLVLDDEGFAGTAGVKLQLLRSGQLRFAGYGTLVYANSFDGDSDLIAGLVGGVVSLCIDRPCHSTLSAFAAASFARGDDSELPVVVSASWVQRFHEHIKLAVEIDGAYASGEIDELSSAAVITAGTRLVWPSLALELGAIGTIADGDFEVVPVPWASVTIRGGLSH